MKNMVGIICDINSYSKAVMGAGLLLGSLCLVLSAVLWKFAPHAESYSQMLSTSAGLLEAALACVAVGVLISVICEIIYKNDIF